MNGTSDLEFLVQDLKRLLSEEETTGSTESKFQSPIKGSWNNSGGFDPSMSTPSHPKGHMGIDMRVAGGTSVYPLTSGVVSDVGFNSKSGNFISIQHPENTKSFYAHLGTVNVHKGDRVDANTIIGTVGDTGNAKGTWPHLHFQVWKNNQIQNPANFFSVPAYSNVDSKREKRWLSDNSKTQADSFNMNNHLSAGKRSVSEKINELLKIASIYKDLTDS